MAPPRMDRQLKLHRMGQTLKLLILSVVTAAADIVTAGLGYWDTVAERIA